MKYNKNTVVFKETADKINKYKIFITYNFLQQELNILKKIISVFIAVILVVSTQLCAFASETPDFELNTDAVLLVNSDTDEVLYSKNADKKMLMASTTKIMTYIVVAETVDDLANTKITIEQKPIDDILDKDASVAGFKNHIGESFSVLDILYGMMIPSGCDAAQILAYYAGGGDVNNFIDMMNKKALELDCKNTHFNDAHGLSEQDHYTTAEDMYKITKYALTMPYFKEIVNTEYYTLPGDTEPLINTNYLIDYVNGRQYYYQYATGIKTGYTDLAGKCLVSSATMGDTNLICIAFGGKYDAETNYVNYAMVDSVNLYKWAFENLSDYIDISLDSKYKSVQIGEKIQLTAEVAGSNTDVAHKIKWSSSNTNIATVDENGVVTAVSMGEAQIKAETEMGSFAVCTLACGYYNGIDVTSRYGDYTSGQKEPIDWKAVKDYGIDFAIIRAGWGWEDYPNQNDATFVENVKGAVENGIPVGLNFVAYATDVENARLEAEYLLKEIDEYIPEYKQFISLPVSYNMSDSQYRQFSSEQNTAIALEFNRVMNENGYKCMCYSNKSTFANIDVSALKKAGMGLWYAYYPYKPDFSEKIKINGEYVPDVWQYRTDGYLPEASENLNTKQSIIYMLSSELEQYQTPEVTAEQVKNEKAVNITWQQVPYNTDGYTVYRKSADSEQLQKIADLSPSELKYTDTDLMWNDSYTYYVSAKVTDFLNKNYVKEIIGVCDNAVSIINPSEETTNPTQNTTTNPTTEPTDSTATNPTTESTDSTATNPMTEPTDPTATNPTTESTDPTATNPTTEPTNPTTTNPTTEPTDPTTTNPTTEPTDPTVTNPTTEPTDPTSAKPTTSSPSLANKSVKKSAGSTYRIVVNNAGGKKITYSSDNKKILRVSSKGKVTFLKKGSGTVTVKVGSKKLTFKGTVTSDPKLIYKNKAVKASKVYKVKKGNTLTIKIKGKVSALNNKYNSTKIAKIKGKAKSSKIKIVGLKKGKTTLKITVNHAKVLKIKVKVK